MRIYFEPIDLEIGDRHVFEYNWKALQKNLLNYGILIPDICRILNVDENGFVIEKEIPQ